MYDRFAQIVLTTIIWGITIFCPLLIVAIWGQWISVALFAIIWLVVVYGSFIEPNYIMMNRQVIHLPKITMPIRIALVSDLHYGPHKKYRFAQKTVQKILQERPDLVLIAGDVICSEMKDIKFLEPWKKLATNIPTYYTFGNHEYFTYFYKRPPRFDLAEATRNKLKNLDVRVLQNANELVTIRGQKFYIIGFGDLWAHDLRVDNALAEIDSHYATIGLVHNPDAAPAIQNRVNLLLAGHTHGGQVRLPLLGPVGIIPTMLGQKYDKGWFTFQNTKLFITSGLGETNAQIRLFNPPEIVILTISPTS